MSILEKTILVDSQPLDHKRAEALQICKRIINIHTELLKLNDLRPEARINRLLTDLVTLCSRIHSPEVTQQVLNNELVKEILPSLRRICSQAESCLESHWAGYITDAATQGPDAVEKRYKSFPYFGNYEDIARLELGAMLSAEPTVPRKISFIGSGPLPLTSLCLLDLLKRKNDSLASTIGERVGNNQPPVLQNIDCDLGALTHSKNLCMALGPRAEGMEFTHGMAGTAQLVLSDSDVVYTAALVGLTQEDKEEIILKIGSTMRKGALLIVRSAWGLRTCLYPEVDMTSDRLLEMFEPCAVVHPYGQIVNSVFVARVR